MIKLIAFREDSWFTPMVEEQMFNHLAHAYGGEAQMIRDWSEAVVPENHTIIVAEEAGSLESKDYKHPADAVYVFGRTHMATATLINYCNPKVIIRIDTPQAVELWGIQVAAMILRDRQNQGL